MVSHIHIRHRILHKKMSNSDVTVSAKFLRVTFTRNWFQPSLFHMDKLEMVSSYIQLLKAITLKVQKWCSQARLLYYYDCKKFNFNAPLSELQNAMLFEPVSLQGHCSDNPDLVTVPSLLEILDPGSCDDNNNIIPLYFLLTGTVGSL